MFLLCIISVIMQSYPVIMQSCLRQIQVEAHKHNSQICANTYSTFAWRHCFFNICV